VPIRFVAIWTKQQTSNISYGSENPRLPKNRVGDNAMEILLPLAIYFAIWVLVIWGASYFNKNVV
jgi:hypothetical protein